MSNYLKANQKKERLQKNKKAVKDIKRTLLAMNKVYLELKDKDYPITREHIEEIASIPFSDNIIDLMLKDFNDENNVE